MRLFFTMWSLTGRGMIHQMKTALSTGNPPYSFPPYSSRRCDAGELCIKARQALGRCRGVSVVRGWLGCLATWGSRIIEFAVQMSVLDCGPPSGARFSRGGSKIRLPGRARRPESQRAPTRRMATYLIEPRWRPQASRIMTPRASSAKPTRNQSSTWPT